MPQSPVALITGAARRLGATIASRLHAEGYRVVVHYRQSASQADALVARLNEQRADSARALPADLGDALACADLAEQAQACWGRLDLLVNNASDFHATPIGSIERDDWERLFASNALGPLFLSQAAAPALTDSRGAIVNLVDVHAERPLRGHTVYCMAKAALAMATRSLALELGPAVRVNGIAPGAILWPEASITETEKAEILARTALQRRGEPEDIAATVVFLARESYITGQILAVDGGRSLNM